MIYFDHHASTPCDKRVVEAMLPYFTQYFANPSGSSLAHRGVIQAIDHARSQISTVLDCEDSEIYFSSGATEAINLQLIGYAYANSSRGKHILSSPVEHKAVLNTLLYLQSKGFEVELVPVEKSGKVNFDSILSRVKKETILASFMWGNNEIGAITDIPKLAELLMKRDVPLHTDATQMPLYQELKLKESDVAMASMSGHKVYGPKGVGVMYVRKKPRVRLERISLGGGQEKGLRSGTHNVPAIIGMGKAFELLESERSLHVQKVVQLNAYFRNKIGNDLPSVEIHTPLEQSLPSNLNLSFPKLSIPTLIPHLEDKFVLSSGSSCNASMMQASHVLTEIGVPETQALSALRIGLGKENTEGEIDEFVSAVLPLLKKYS